MDRTYNKKLFLFTFRRFMSQGYSQEIARYLSYKHLSKVYRVSNPENHT